MDIKIRRAKINDVDELIQLLRELFSIEADFSFDEKKQRQGLTLLIERKNSCRCIQIAELDHQVVGMCTAQTLISTAEGGPVAVVEDMMVAPAYRSKGIGRKLISHIKMWAQKQGITRLQLLADQTNTNALAFYQKMDWQLTQLICLRYKWASAPEGNAA